MSLIYPIPNGLRMRIKPTNSTMFGPISVVIVGATSAESAVNNGERHIGEIPADLDAYGIETSQVAIACWQEGKKIFSTNDFNTVLFGNLAGDSAVILKNNTDGAETLAISLKNRHCFVII